MALIVSLLFAIAIFMINKCYYKYIDEQKADTAISFIDQLPNCLIFRGVLTMLASKFPTA
jgi:hypothetical protein